MEWHLIWKGAVLVVIAAIAVKVMLDFKREPNEEDK